GNERVFGNRLERAGSLCSYPRFDERTPSMPFKSLRSSWKTSRSCALFSRRPPFSTMSQRKDSGSFTFHVYAVNRPSLGVSLKSVCEVPFTNVKFLKNVLVGLGKRRSLSP